jgi:low affinity Fe/Cu permease
MYPRTQFDAVAKWTAHAAGRPRVFAAAFAVVILWGLLGPVFHFSDSWQLVINTGTTIVTFLMVFLIQNTQNRDGEAVQIKLDELIRTIEGAHNALLDLEELSERELNAIKRRYGELAERARSDLRAGRRDTDKPEVAFD